MHLYLASRSPQRLELLLRAGYEVDIVASGVDEPPLENFPSPESYVLCAACLKASEARVHVPAGLLLAADTLAVVEGRPLGKPADRNEAEQMLRSLSGSAHQVHSGLCLCKMPESIYVAAVETTNLRMRRWTESEIAAYLDSEEWVGKAGAYAIQETAERFVQQREGSLTNVIGLPMERLEELVAHLERSGEVL